MAKQVRLTLAKALAKANLRRAEAGEKAITMNALAVAAGAVTARKDDAPAAVQAAIDNVAGSSSISACGGLIHTTSG